MGELYQPLYRLHYQHVGASRANILIHLGERNKTCFPVVWSRCCLVVGKRAISGVLMDRSPLVEHGYWHGMGMGEHSCTSMGCDFRSCHVAMGKCAFTCLFVDR